MNSEQISFRLPKKLLDAINGLAVDEMRSRTNMIEFILTDWINEKRPAYLNDDEEYSEKLKKIKKT